MLGSHGRKGLAKLTLGSVAEWAIDRLHYPVLVAGPMCDKSLFPMRSIVLATDLTEQACVRLNMPPVSQRIMAARLTIVNVLPEGEHGKEKRTQS